MKPRISYFIVLVTVMGLFSACTAASVQPTAAAPTQPPPVTETPRPSETPAPSNTSTPVPTASFTMTPSATSTPTETPTETSTPTPIFAGFSVTYAQYTYFGMLIGFKIPGIKENYRLKVNDIDYTCKLNEKAPDSLYCYGPQFSQDAIVDLVFYPLSGDDTPLYEVSYKVSLLVPPTVDPRILMTQSPGSCPQRGVNATCETEYRNNGEGGYCIVATCNDACGYWFSMDTCPEGSANNGIFPMTGTPPLPPIHP